MCFEYKYNNCMYIYIYQMAQQTRGCVKRPAINPEPFQAKHIKYCLYPRRVFLRHVQSTPPETLPILASSQHQQTRPTTIAYNWKNITVARSSRHTLTYKTYAILQYEYNTIHNTYVVCIYKIVDAICKAVYRQSLVVEAHVSKYIRRSIRARKRIAHTMSGQE